MPNKLFLNLSMAGTTTGHITAQGQAAVACYELIGANGIRLQVPVPTIDASGNPNTDCSNALASAMKTWAMGGVVCLLFDAGPAPHDANFTTLFNLTADADYSAGNAAPNYSRPHAPISGETGFISNTVTAAQNAALWLKMAECYEYAINLFVSAANAAGHNPSKVIMIEWWNEPNYVAMVPGSVSSTSVAYIGQSTYLSTQLSHGDSSAVMGTYYAPHYNWVAGDYAQTGRMANLCFGNPSLPGAVLLPLLSATPPGGTTTNLATAYSGITIPVGTQVSVVPVDENGKIATLDPLFRGMSNVIVPYLKSRFGQYKFLSHSIAGDPVKDYYALNVSNNYFYGDITNCSEAQRITSCFYQNDPFWLEFDYLNLHLYCANPVNDIATPLGGSAYTNTLGGLSAVFNKWKARLSYLISLAKTFDADQQFTITECGVDETNLGILTTNQSQAVQRNNDMARGWLFGQMVHYTESNPDIIFNAVYSVTGTGSAGNDMSWCDNSGNVYQLFRAICSAMQTNGDLNSLPSLFAQASNIPSTFVYGGTFANSGSAWSSAATVLTTAQHTPI